jgi:hypothetical protein
MLFGWIERRATRERYACAWLGIAMILFYFNIRGEWLSLPAQAGIALALLGCCRVAGRSLIDAPRTLRWARSASVEP